jgi:hypothetical protein
MLAIVLNIALWIWLFIQFPPTSDTVFLHYNVLFGVDLIGAWWRVLWVPILGAFIILLNTVVGWFSFAYDQFIATLCLVVCVAVQLLLYPAVYVLIFLNV